MKVILLEPSERYIEFIENSHHYLNSPKYCLNESINALIRHNYSNKDRAKELVSAYLKKHYIKCDNLNELIEYHLFTRQADFILHNVNSYLYDTPKHIINLNEKVSQWYKDNNTNFNEYIVGSRRKINMTSKPYPFKYIL